MTVDDLPVLPVKPGVYIFRTPAGRVIYVGKANSIRSRVRSHFTAGGKSSRITRDAGSLEFITTRNEVEALVLEANLIKQHRPRYNVLLKDDKHYPFLKVTAEDYPMLLVTRKVVKDGARYYGPYPDARAVWRVKHLIDTIFALRKNSGIPFTPRKRPCLNYHMKRCLAPCVGYTTPEEYGTVVQDVVSILEGKSAEVLARLQGEMKDAAQRREFEQASALRDRIDAVRKLFHTEQMALSPGLEDMDFLGVAQAGEFAMTQLFQMRGGKVIGRDKRFLTGAEEATPDEILKAFMADYYGVAQQVPPLVLIPHPFDDAEAWMEFLGGRAGRKVELRAPQRGEKVELLDLAMRNAQIGLESELALLEKRGENPGLEALREALALPERPWRIEGYDNSNLFGTNIVSGMVVFEGGRARRGEHRRFKVKGLTQPDDYAAMRQTITRRFTGGLSEKLPMPDLLMIDGGRGQVNAALDALREVGIQVPVVGLAKREETIVLPSVYGAQWWLTAGTEVGRNRELRLQETHPALRMLIAVRDEVHQFAITYHRKLRGEGMMRSVFDGIPGIGPKRREALLDHFTSIEELKAAPVEVIARVPGVGLLAARAIKTSLNAPQEA
ncbi:MAG TPA: excinuclease ABC subunit UvrC [Deinococcales bacterium]|nr:excinuclease ABC subunit UvrC [Deinococcales bacterium]